MITKQAREELYNLTLAQVAKISALPKLADRETCAIALYQTITGMMVIAHVLIEQVIPNPDERETKLSVTRDELFSEMQTTMKSISAATRVAVEKVGKKKT
jgi:hypothetical protein